jgi:CHAT domain
MQVNGLIIEELNENGDLKSFVLNKDYKIGDLWIAFPDEYDSPRNSPFHFLDDTYEKMFDSVYDRHKMRKVGGERFRKLDENTFEFFTNWDNIPVKESYELYYYALYLPKYAIPLTMNISVKNNLDNGYEKIEKIVKDKNRYVVYIPCKGSSDRYNQTPQSLKLQITFEINKVKFKSQVYREVEKNWEKEVITNKEFLEHQHLINKKEYLNFEKLLELVESNNIETMHKTKLSDISVSNKIKILFVSANPNDSSRIRIDEEYREIKEGINLSDLRTKFDLQIATAARVKDLRREILNKSPNIVHFSGHGAKQGIYLEDDNGNSHLVPKDALNRFFELFQNEIKCVILNACYSKEQAEGISESIEYVIGMNDAVPDRAAILFSIGFYDAMGAGKNIEEAFKFGVNSIDMNNINGGEIPELIRRK